MLRLLGRIATVVLVPISARATYSICATDMAAREVGGSGTSCIAPQSVYIIYGSAPGHGVVHAQALYHEPGKLEAVSRLNLDEPPLDIITAITDTAFDPLSLLRQYGIADLMGRTAGFTGVGTMAYAEDRQGITDTFPYSVQGNILTSVAVIDQAESAFVDGGGCDLADRLMLALEAGANNGEGDSRCTPNGVPSDAAFIEVDREGEPARFFLYLEVSNTAPASPLPLLRQQFDSWRLTHPCPPMPDGGMPDLGVDMSLPPDAGPMPDGPPVDVGLGLDAGPPPDAPLVRDAGTSADVGVVVDAALPADAALSMDAGVGPEDTGSALDLGDPDAPATADAPQPNTPDSDALGGGDAPGGCACQAGAAVPPLWTWVAALMTACLARRRLSR